MLPTNGAFTYINKYDLLNSKITEYKLGFKGFTTALSASPDGKYISYATYEENNGSDSRAYLYLLDAETMKQVKELGNWDSEGQRINSIHFSPDSKYLTYNTEYFEINFPILIFHIPTFKVLQNIDRKTFNYSKYVGLDLKLLDSNKYLIKLIGANLNNRDVDLFMKDIETNQIVFQTKYDVYNNIIDFSDYKYFCNIVKQNSAFCFDLKNIISGIPTINTLYIRYNNKKIIINSIEKSINQISIMTIEGREVYRQNFLPSNTNNPIEIPIELSNGLYLINITTGKESFTEKIIVIE